MPAGRVFAVLAVSTLLVAVGVLVPWAGRTALALDTVVLALVAVDWLRARRVPLKAERRWPPLLVQGTPADVELMVELGETAPGPAQVRLRDALDPALAHGPHREDVELRPGRRRRLTYGIRPRQRGEHVAGPVVARVLGPWRLAWSQRELVAPEPRRVFPQIRWTGKVGSLLALAHRGALGVNPQSLRGLGTEPYALREYLPGDPMSRIHWKATARHGRPVTREDTWERSARLLVLLDRARGMAGPGERDGERTKLDHSLAAALALSRVASARGDRVTLVAFSDRIDRTVRLTGPGRIAAAYGALYDLEPRPVEPAFDLAASAAMTLETRSATVVLFTSIVDLAAVDLLRHALGRLERRHRPLLVNLEDPELRHLAHEPQDDAAGAFAHVDAQGILLANRGLTTRLRHAGIRAVHAPADRLALEALEAYLAMFRRRAA